MTAKMPQHFGIGNPLALDRTGHQGFETHTFQVLPTLTYKGTCISKRSAENVANKAIKYNSRLSHAEALQWPGWMEKL